MLLKEIGISETMLPEVLAPGECIGYITKQQPSRQDFHRIRKR